MKKIKHSFTKKELLLVRAGLAVIAVSILSPTVLPASVIDVASQERQDIRATNDIARVRRQNQQYWDAVAVYRDLVREGVIEAHNLEIMKPETYEKYLDTAYVNLLRTTDGHTSAFAAQDDAENEFDALPERYQRLLDGYRYNLGFCPKTLQRYHLSGFYDLCVRLIDETNSATAIDMRKAADELNLKMPTLKERLEMMGDISQKKLVEDAQDAAQ